MDIKELEERIEKKKVKIEKLNKKIQKWEDAKLEENVLKYISKYTMRKVTSMEDLINYRKETCPQDDAYFWAINSIAEREHECTEEIERAIRELEDAKKQLETYECKLAKEKADNLYIENNGRVEIIWKFLLNYKASVTAYVECNLADLNNYLSICKEYAEWNNTSWKLPRAEETKIRKEYKAKKEDAAMLVNPLTFDCYDYLTKSIDNKKLSDILNKDIDAKYKNMIDRVTKVVGEVVDGSMLSIGGDGNINGIIKGKNDTAKMRTILAGGYNTNEIVNVRRGPILHYRLLVNKEER